MSSDADDQLDLEADEIALLSGEAVDEEVEPHHRSTLFEVCPFILGEANYFTCWLIAMQCEPSS